MPIALLSVSDKSGIVEFASQLLDHGYELLSSGGTYKTLVQAGLTVTEVSAYTGFPEIMGGRVKTLHPKIHGGILGRRDQDQDTMAEHAIDAIDLVCVNLYPFAQTIAREDVTLSLATENIDIGGPAMIRAAAKNNRWVSVVVNPQDYTKVLTAIAANNLNSVLRLELAQQAFNHTAQYDRLIADFYAQALQDPNNTATSKTATSKTVTSKSTTHLSDALPETLAVKLQKIQDLRYGENSHQHAAVYAYDDAPAASLVKAQLVQGKPMSYNNIADADAALSCVREFNLPACIIVKHANPCGAAVADTVFAAYELAYATDPTAAFGGIIAINQMFDDQLCEKILSQQFVEVIIAPKAAPAAIERLKQKPNIRLLLVDTASPTDLQSKKQLKSVDGGLLVQDQDMGQAAQASYEVVTARAPSEQEMIDLKFAWLLAKYVKSNAIVYAKDGAAVGVGAGQMSRVFSAKIATIKAADEGLVIKGSVLASDAFFPFRDGVDIAAAAGVTAIIQPGGSMRDGEVIAAANEAGIAMIFTGVRHFRH